MILFNTEIVDLVNKYFSVNKEYVESVLLASCGFNVQFLNFNIQCNERVFATLGGATYEWDDAPSSHPWGLLGRQLAVKAYLKSPSIFTISFASGDSIDIETCENQYESVIFNFPSQDGSLMMEIF